MPWRFLLDNDVDVEVGRVLRRAGHDVVTAWEVGLAGRDSAPDDALTVYAHDTDRVVVTHDKEFTLRRRSNSVGRHVRLVCDQSDAPDVVTRHADALVEMLGWKDNVVIELGVRGPTLFQPKWS